MATATATKHHVRIVSPDGLGVLTSIELDGKPLLGVTAVKFEIGPIGYQKNDAVLTLRLFADVEIEGEPEIVKEWRRAES